MRGSIAYRHERRFHIHELLCVAAKNNKNNMAWQTRKIYKNEYPEQLLQLSRLPAEMDIAGTMPSYDNSFLCVVGSREHTEYGKDVCSKIISDLRGYPIVIVSGLAFGLDSIAHQTALDNGLKTIAFPGSGLSQRVLYPSTRRDLAERIVESGGAVISPFKPHQEGAIWTFPNRNRLMAGISQATLIIEAEKESGTLITAGAALEFGRELLVVPGSIFSDHSYGAYSLLKAGGASPARSSADVLEALGFIDSAESIEEDPLPQRNIDQFDLSREERSIYETLMTGRASATKLTDSLQIPATILSISLSCLELKDLIIERNGFYQIKR